MPGHRTNISHNKWPELGASKKLKTVAISILGRWPPKDGCRISPDLGRAGWKVVLLGQKSNWTPRIRGNFSKMVSRISSGQVTGTQET